MWYTLNYFEHSLPFFHISVEGNLNSKKNAVLLYCLDRSCHQAESELQRATMDAARTTKQLEETIDEFERQKIRDIKVLWGSPQMSVIIPHLFQF